MNKAKLKSYAPEARRDFIQMIRQRADLLGLTKKEIAPAATDGNISTIEGRPYPKSFAASHKKLADKIRIEGAEQLIERVAYSWFNRFAALRFMEINNFLAHGFRVLSNREAGKNEPEILTHAADVDLPGLDKAKVIEFKLDGSADAELYKMLLIAQSNELNRAMPFLFERVNDETEILLPENLLASDSVIRKMVAAIGEDDWKEVEIIGWLYQFYISEKKDEVIGKTVKSEDIPAATQLFTPNWIVKYMTQNSLGRLWLEANPHSSLTSQMEFYITRSAGSLPASSAITDEETSVSRNIPEDATRAGRLPAFQPEDIKILDPACGSGHILVEAYELLKAIYLERGYSSRDIPRLILEKNLFGLDIDERAAQLSAFALMMKARTDDRRLFEADAPKLNIETVPDSSRLGNSPAEIAEMFFINQDRRGAVAIRDGGFLFDEMETQPSLLMSDDIGGNPRVSKGVLLTAATDTLAHARVSASDEVSEQNIIDLLELFAQGKTLGSLIRIPHGFSRVIDELAQAIEAKHTSGNFYEQIAARELEPFVRAGRMLARQYDCVIANPPYMGGKGMNAELKAFAAKNFPDSKSDLFAMFIERGFELLKKDGLNAMVTMQSWMFLSSYEKLREKLLDEKTIATMAHLGARAFAEISGEVVQTTAFVILNKHLENYKPAFFRLVELSESKKVAALQNDEYLFNDTKQDDFKKIPGSPIAYWVSDKVREVFEKGTPLSEIADAKQGMSTANNPRFTRLWFEVSKNQIGLGFENSYFAEESDLKWFPYNKGGEFRKWFGNNEFVVNWKNNGEEIKKYTGSAVRNESFYFRSGITWTDISSSSFGVRQLGNGYLFANSGSCVFYDESNVLLGFLITKITFNFLKLMNPTLHFEVGNIAQLPFNPALLNGAKSQINKIVEEAVAIARADWDSFETSWDFRRFPMLDRQQAKVHRQNEDADGHSRSTDAPFASDDAARHLTDDRKQAADEAIHLTDEAKHSPDAPLQVTDAPLQVTDASLQLSDASSQPTDASLRVTDASLRVTDEPLQLSDASLQLSDEPLRTTRADAASVEECWRDWNHLCETRISRMQKLETENNRLFINAYGLEDELAPEVPLAQITLARADAEKDVRRLASYFIGCLMGRYSLDEDGLIYADAGNKGFDESRYQTFPADEDGIVPVTDIEWFAQEAARQFEQFIAVAFSKNQKQEINRDKEDKRDFQNDLSLSIPKIPVNSSSRVENLRWIAEQLGAKASETPIETIRRYFSTAFFKDHLQTYKKRPIYWLFSSGKQKAFECLVYLHRYSENTLPRMRHEYVLPLMSKLTANIETLDKLKESAATTSEKAKLDKQREVLQKKQTELARFDEKLRHAADLKINLDLDDGVKVNYGKFGDLLAEVKQVATTKE